MKKEELIEDDAYLFEMSNLRKRETGLPVNIYISDGRSYGNKIPRLKVMTSTSDNMDPHNTVSILIKKISQRMILLDMTEYHRAFLIR